MVKFLRLLLAVVVGWAVGSVVNLGLIHVGGSVVPPPAGVDVSTMEGLKAAFPLFEPKHFVFPFLAHALGTLVGALVAGLLAPNRSAGPAYAVGTLFLLGGIAAVALFGGPIWFTVVDLLFAYLPMAWLGQKLAMRMRGGAVAAT